MNKYLFIIAIAGMVAACHHTTSKPMETAADKRIMLRSDTLNVVKMTDTMVIYESTCRGCAFEGSTSFALTDTLGVVELDQVETYDHNKPDMDGGSIAKNLVIIPKKTGATTIRVYKFWQKPVTAKDSANVTTYTIEVKN